MGAFWIYYLFSILALYNVTAAYSAVRNGDIKTHKANMIGLYIGGLVIAGSFTLAPGRLIHGWLFG